VSGHAVEPEPHCQVCGKTYANGERFCSLDGGPVLAPLEDQIIDGRYRVVRQLGKGGMGVVYEAEHVALGKPVAIKFLSAALRDAEAQARFTREAKIASRIVHEHVVQIFDVGSHDGRAYLVMELVTGRDVRKTLEEDGPLAPARAVRVAIQMLRGLAAIHHAGILHRDIKPANVLLTERDGDPDFVKIMDFGISKSIDGAATTSAGTLTDTGKVLGTPQYMAPEQLVGAPTDHRADLYATGLTLYAMLAGEAPFASTSFTKVAAMHVSVEAPPVDTFRPGLPRPLVLAVAKALSKSPESRFRDAAHMADVLESIEIPGDVPPVVETARGAATVRERPATYSDEPTAKASPGARRRVVVPALAISVSILVGAILIVRALREDGTDELPAKAPVAAPALDAATVDAPTSAMHMQYALQAEREGRLEAAIGAYEAVYDLEKGPGILWHIAELHERSGDRAAAAATLRRFLAVAPPGEREAAEKRIAWLDPPPADGGVASVAPKPRPAKPATAATVAPAGEGRYCVCASLDRTTTLCPALERPVCTCASDESRPATLCQRPFVPCDGRDCDRLNPQVRCANAGYLTTSRVVPDEPCSGYHPLTNERIDARYACNMCPGADRRSYRGKPGDSCTGISAWAGSRAMGELERCTEQPEPFRPGSP